MSSSHLGPGRRITVGRRTIFTSKSLVLDLFLETPLPQGPEFKIIERSVKNTCDFKLLVLTEWDRVNS